MAFVPGTDTGVLGIKTHGSFLLRLGSQRAKSVDASFARNSDPEIFRFSTFFKCIMLYDLDFAPVLEILLTKLLYSPEGTSTSLCKKQWTAKKQLVTIVVCISPDWNILDTKPRSLNRIVQRGVVFTCVRESCIVTL